MQNQELIKLICALAGCGCIAFGIYALFTGLKAEGVIDISALAKGKIKTGSAGVMLLFFGAILFGMVILKGATSTKRDVTETTQPVAGTNASAVIERKIHEESGGRDYPMP